MNKLLYLAGNIISSNFKDLRFPYRCTCILTYKCQLKCNMCNIWQKDLGNELSLEEIERFFKKYNRFSWINLSGGEIFLREDLPGILESIYRNCRHLYLLDFPTNGFLTQRIVKTVEEILELYRIPKLLLTVSLDGPRSLHDQIRGVPGAWDRAVETFSRLKALKNNRFDVFLGMTLQSSNAESFSETFSAVREMVPELRYSDFHINIVQVSPHYYSNAGSASLEDKRSLMCQLDSIMKMRTVSLFNPIGILERRYQKLAKKYLQQHHSPLACEAFSASFFMDPRGFAHPCSIYNKPIGNIRDYDYDLRRLWDESGRLGLRKEILRGKCPQCWTPCEAYQSILANLLPVKKIK